MSRVSFNRRISRQIFIESTYVVVVGFFSIVICYQKLINWTTMKRIFVFVSHTYDCSSFGIGCGSIPQTKKKTTTDWEFISTQVEPSKYIQTKNKTIFFFFSNFKNTRRIRFVILGVRSLSRVVRHSTKHKLQTTQPVCVCRVPLKNTHLENNIKSRNVVKRARLRLRFTLKWLLFIIFKLMDIFCSFSYEHFARHLKGNDHTENISTSSPISASLRPPRPTHV